MNEPMSFRPGESRTEFELRRRLEELRMLDSAYSKAKAMVESCARMPEAESVCRLVLEFKRGDTGDVAIYILGEAKAWAQEFLGPIDVIAEYERKKTLIESLRATVDNERATREANRSR